MGLRWFAFFADHHFCPLIGFEQQRQIDSAGVGCRVSFHQREICFFDQAVLKLLAQIAVHFRFQRKKHNAAGVRIQPVNNPDLTVQPLLENIADVGQFRLPAIGNYRNSGWLADCQQSLISIQNFQRQFAPVAIPNVLYFLNCIHYYPLNITFSKIDYKSESLVKQVQSLHGKKIVRRKNRKFWLTMHKVLIIIDKSIFEN